MAAGESQAGAEAGRGGGVNEPQLIRLWGEPVARHVVVYEQEVSTPTTDGKPDVRYVVVGVVKADAPKR